jgi:hypothetical protein
VLRAFVRLALEVLGDFLRLALDVLCDFLRLAVEAVCDFLRLAAEERFCRRIEGELSLRPLAPTCDLPSRSCCPVRPEASLRLLFA